MGILRDNLHGGSKGLGPNWRMSQQRDTGWGSTNLTILVTFNTVNFSSVLPESLGLSGCWKEPGLSLGQGPSSLLPGTRSMGADS